MKDYPTCKVKITKNRSVVNFEYEIDGQKLEKVTEFCDLGILVTHNFSWQKHINNICKNANKRI